MNKKRRVLLVDSESSGEKLERAIQTQLGAHDMQVHVAHAKSHERAERLLWRPGKKKRPRHFDLGVVTNSKRNS